MPHYRFSRGGCVSGLGEYVITEPLVPFGILDAGFEILLVKDPPWSHGELHHRHHRVNLAGTDDQRLVELIRVDAEEAAVFPASDHVRAGVGVAEQA